MEHHLFFIEHHLFFMEHHLFFMEHHLFFMEHHLFFMAHHLFFMEHHLFFMGNHLFFMTHHLFFMTHHLFFMSHNVIFFSQQLFFKKHHLFRLMNLSNYSLSLPNLCNQHITTLVYQNIIFICAHLCNLWKIKFLKKKSPDIEGLFFIIIANRNQNHFLSAKSASSAPVLLRRIPIILPASNSQFLFPYSQLQILNPKS